MRSAIVLTQEIDDMEKAAEELASGIKGKLEFGTSSLGIVYGDADMQVAELGKLLHENLGFDIVGLTTTAVFSRFDGYCDMGCTLAVMTGDDVDIAVGSTGDLEEGDYRERIEEAYQSAQATLSEDPKLMLVFAPYIADITSENYVEVLDEVSGNVPIFGGVATDHYDLDYQKTFFNGEEFSAGLVFALISGNIKPVFAMEHDFGAGITRKGTITKASGNIVEKIDDKLFKEWLSEMMPLPDDEDVVFSFQSTPFIMELPDYDPSEQPVVRALSTIDHKTGGGGFLSKMPEGSQLYINVIQRENLAQSCGATLDKLIERMEENPAYDYSLMLASTCNARHLLLGDTKDLETKILIEKLADSDPDLNAMGYYGFGEICPTRSNEGGITKNRFHNVSFALCAF